MTTLPSKNPSKNLVFTEIPYRAPSKNPSKKHLLLENLLRTLLRSVPLHDPLGVRPILGGCGAETRPERLLSGSRKICTEQMDAEGLGRKLLENPNLLK